MTNGKHQQPWVIGVNSTVAKEFIQPLQFNEVTPRVRGVHHSPLSPWAGPLCHQPQKYGNSS